MFTHRHADGGFYTYLGPQEGKHHASGEWVEGVCYQGIDLKLYWTDLVRWNERFEELPPSKFEGATTADVVQDGEVIASFTFSVKEAAEVRHMIVTANSGAARPYVGEIPNQVRSVLAAQAEMVSKGLHLLDIDYPDMIGDVHAFHVKFKQADPEDPLYDRPKIIEEGLHDFRVKFHDEETEEYRDEREPLLDAVERKDHREIVNSLEIQIDSLADAVWVILGTADLQFGRRRFMEAWRRVVKANMAKVLATEDPNAKDSGRDVKYDIRKPEGWTPPDHRDLVQDYVVPWDIIEVPTAQEG